MRDLPSGTVTFLFTDVEGSTRLLQDYGDGYAELLAEHRKALREAFARHGGVEVDTQGDAFFAAFPQASAAVSAAAELQGALADGVVRVRVGVHTGEPKVTDEGYDGMDVHRAARIAAAAHGGQVVLSQSTRDLLGDGVSVRDLREHRLKDLVGAEPLSARGWRLPAAADDRCDQPSVRGQSARGRTQELSELVAMLSNGSRLVTITGPGGTGKTRLGLQVAAELVGRMRDGVFWVPLAALADPDLVVPEVAQTIGARDDLGGFLEGKELLLLLDNLEHLAEAAPALGALLAGSGSLRVLATSRGPLRLHGERV